MKYSSIKSYPKYASFLQKVQKKFYFSAGKIELESSYLKFNYSNKPYLLYPDFTVGIGISPIQLLLRNSSWTLTTGREFHPAPEDEPCIIVLHLYYTRPVKKSNSYAHIHIKLDLNKNS